MKSNKLIAIGLAAAMVCSGFSGMTVCAGEMPEAVQQELQDTESIDSTGKSSEGFRYYKNMEEDTISISGYCGSNTEITIPSELDGKKVTRIGSWAFEDNNNLTGVTIADGITEIGVRAFAGCSNLSSVTIPASVSNIEGVAFSECEKLHTIKVDSRNSNYIPAFIRCAAR